MIWAIFLKNHLQIYYRELYCPIQNKTVAPTLSTGGTDRTLSIFMYFIRWSTDITKEASPYSIWWTRQVKKVDNYHNDESGSRDPEFLSHYFYLSTAKNHFAISRLIIPFYTTTAWTLTSYASKVLKKNSAQMNQKSASIEKHKTSFAPFLIFIKMQVTITNEYLTYQWIESYLTFFCKYLNWDWSTFITRICIITLNFSLVLLLIFQTCL